MSKCQYNSSVTSVCLWKETPLFQLQCCAPFPFAVKEFVLNSCITPPSWCEPFGGDRSISDRTMILIFPRHLHAAPIERSAPESDINGVHAIRIPLHKDEHLKSILQELLHQWRPIIAAMAWVIICNSFGFVGFLREGSASLLSCFSLCFWRTVLCLSAVIAGDWQ